MSFIITANVREGIVMASDSRLSLTTTSTTKKGDHQTVIKNVCIGQSDFSYKTFLAHKRCGISTYGAADIKGVPIAGYIESFISTLPQGDDFNIRDVPQMLLDFFARMQQPPDTGFHVAGYEVINSTYKQAFWRIAVRDNLISESETTINEGQGVAWDGESDIFGRLVKPVALCLSNGKYSPYPEYTVPYEFFTLQDAIDYCIYAIRTTIDTMRFQNRPKTVSDPIDVLVIKPSESIWIQKKALHGE